MPRLLIVACLTAALLNQGCADTNHGTVVARSAGPPTDLWADQTPPVATCAAQPGDVLKPTPITTDPSMRDWMNDHPIVQVAVALGVMAAGAIVAYYSLTDAPKKKT